MPPTYEYGCECGNNWEEFQSISAPPATKCPKCEKETAKRLIGTTQFILKGGGWASEGYK